MLGNTLEVRIIVIYIYIYIDASQFRQKIYEQQFFHLLKPRKLLTDL